jgi:hypothetical protein
VVHPNKCPLSLSPSLATFWFPIGWWLPLPRHEGVAAPLPAHLACRLLQGRSMDVLQRDLGMAHVALEAGSAEIRYLWLQLVAFYDSRAGRLLWIDF